MTPEQIKQLTPDGYGGDFEMTMRLAKSVPNEPVLFNGKDIRTVYPISTFSGTTQDELVELIRQVQVGAQVNRGEDAYGVQVRAQVEVQDKTTMEVGE